VKSWVEISGRRLSANYSHLVKAAGSETAVLAVVKANAYGHGVGVCAPILAKAGAPWLGVTDVVEGAAVREALQQTGIPAAQQLRILVMSGILAEDVAALVRHNLTPVVWQLEHLEWLSTASRQTGSAPLPVHLEIDSGMARQGIAPGTELNALLSWLKAQPTLQLEAVMTHFASSEVAASSKTFAQRKQFEIAIEFIAASGLRPSWLHAGNSSTLDNQGHEQNIAWLQQQAAALGARSMVRAGIALYGYCLPIEQTATADPVHPTLQPALQPLMTWKTRIIGLREIQPGETVGYSATFTASKSMRLALLPVGYADGLRRELSSTNAAPGGWTIVCGQRAAIIGRVSMNLTVVDVTHIPGIAVGDEVILLGDGITAHDHAQLAHTIPYEIVCGVRAASHLV
jgi:alanine racemase